MLDDGDGSAEVENVEIADVEFDKIEEPEVTEDVLDDGEDSAEVEEVELDEAAFDNVDVEVDMLDEFILNNIDEVIDTAEELEVVYTVTVVVAVAVMGHDTRT